MILTCDPLEVQHFWLNDYAPRVLATEARRYPSLRAIENGLGSATEIVPVPIPLHCQDGFNETYYGRLEIPLDEQARRCCSAWNFVPPEIATAYVEALRKDLLSGEWDRKYGHLRTRPEFIGSLHLVVGQIHDCWHSTGLKKRPRRIAKPLETRNKV